MLPSLPVKAAAKASNAAKYRAWPSYGAGGRDGGLGVVLRPLLTPQDHESAKGVLQQGRQQPGQGQGLTPAFGVEAGWRETFCEALRRIIV